MGAVFVMGDLDLAVRGRTYREPEGPHSLVVRGRDLDSALQHLASRADCRAVAVVGLPETIPDMAAFAGRRLMLVDGDSVLATPSQLGAASVTARIVGASKGPKIKGFTYKNKSNERKHWGHRQHYSTIEITGITKG